MILSGSSSRARLRRLASNSHHFSMEFKGFYGVHDPSRSLLWRRRSYVLR